MFEDFDDDDITEYLNERTADELGAMADLVDGVDADVSVWLEAGPADPQAPKPTRVNVWKLQVEYELAYQHRQMAIRAAGHVSRAVQSGRLAPAPSFACRDCGARAECYDHRDYAKPLDVVAVCGPCNQRRGPARTKLTRRQMQQVRARAEERALRAEFTHAVFLQQLRDSLALASESNMSPDRLSADHRKGPAK